VSAPDGTNVLRDIIPTEKEQGSSKDGRKKKMRRKSLICAARVT